MDKVIVVEGVSRRYGGFKALDEISFEVPRGSIYGYLGPNGAGKTTTIKILLDLISRDGGVVEVLGYDPMFNRAKVLQNVGYTPELPSLPRFMTGFEFLVFSGVLGGLSQSEARGRARYLLDLVGLSSPANKKIGKYSKGMMQRLSLANSLITGPELLILDEPTLGMDPIGRVEVRDILIEVAKQGVTIFLSSHLLGEVEKICTHVALIKKGRIIFSGEMEDMIRMAGEGYTIEVTLSKAVQGLDTKLTEMSYVDKVEVDGNRYIIHIVGSEDRRVDIADIIKKCDGLIIEMKMSRYDLETAFLRLVRRGGR
jgi:ABC-2 type transport system ATP-binding protein